MRVLVALGGNAMTAPDGAAGPGEQRAAVEQAMDAVAELVAEGVDVVLTHGNGPQVGDQLAKDELAAAALLPLPPVPLDWCGAQTQGAIGVLVLNALDRALAARGIHRGVAVVVTRTLVDPADPGLARPTKPIGRHAPAGEAQRYVARGQTWEDRGERGWRRVVACPEPLRVLEVPAVEALTEAGFLVVAAGGGGVPVVRDADGSLRGVEAVIDKDLAAVVLGRALGVDVLCIATDVEAAVLGFGSSRARALGRVSPEELRRHAAAGHFAAGSMGPKVEAAARFVETGGQRAVITSLRRLAAGVRGGAGTIVEKSS